MPPTLAPAYNRYARPAATSSRRMPSLSTRYFPHRRNCDGTYDSICMTCFQIVAEGVQEHELAEEDRRHVCSYL